MEIASDMVHQDIASEDAKLSSNRTSSLLGLLPDFLRVGFPVSGNCGIEVGVAVCGAIIVSSVGRVGGPTIVSSVGRVGSIAVSSLDGSIITSDVGRVGSIPAVFSFSGKSVGRIVGKASEGGCMKTGGYVTTSGEGIFCGLEVGGSVGVNPKISNTDFKFSCRFTLIVTSKNEQFGE